jgi:predicted Ser/Thr protein kinase
LIDVDNKVWIIDFDKCGLCSNNKYKQENINRLIRSFKKEKRKNISFFFNEIDVKHLLKGYASY